jgi:hypothetical protein
LVVLWWVFPPPGPSGGKLSYYLSMYLVFAMASF